MLKILTLLAVIMPFSLFAGEYDTKTLLKQKLFYATPDGTISECKYWSVNVGVFELKFNKDFPGEGIVDFSASGDIIITSSGYGEFNGFGDREKTVETTKMYVKDSDTLKTIKYDDIDYISMLGRTVQLKGENSERDLIFKVEYSKQELTAKGFAIEIYNFIKNYGELKFGEAVDPIIAIGFSREATQKAYKIALKSMQE